MRLPGFPTWETVGWVAGVWMMLILAFLVGIHWIIPWWARREIRRMERHFKMGGPEE